MEIKTRLNNLENMVGSRLVDEAKRDPDAIWKRVDALRREANND